MDRKPKGISGDCVLADGFSGTYEAIQTMLQAGHRRIGFVSGPLGYTTSDERLAGYVRALEKNGVAVEQTLIKEGIPTFENGYSFARQLIKEQQVTALFVANNMMTLGAMGFLQDAKVRIPEEVAVIGFDDYDWTRITNPPLSVIKQPAYELGRRAAEIMLHRSTALKRLPFRSIGYPPNWCSGVLLGRVWPKVIDYVTWEQPSEEDTCEDQRTSSAVSKIKHCLDHSLPKYCEELGALPVSASYRDYIIVFKYLPMYGVTIAFKNFNPALGIQGSPWVGLRHFERFFNSFRFWDLLKNTLGLSVFQLVASFPIPILVALMLNQVRHKGYKKFVQTVIYAPHFISTVVLVGIMFVFLSPSSGIVNKAIELWR